MQALIADAWEGEWERPVEVDDLANAVAIVLRVVRDDLVLDAVNNRIHDLLDMELALNRRISSLTGRDTTTGDTT